MASKRGLFLLAIPAVALLALLAALIGTRSEERYPSRPAVAAVPAASPSAGPESRITPRVARPADTAQASTGADAVDVHLRSTYENFRIAVASGNTAVQDVLRSVLRPHRDVALRLAEGELATARSQSERDITLQTLDLLRRIP